MAGAMDMPPSEKPCWKWSLEIPVKLHKPTVSKIFKLVKEDLVPGINVIMI
jgi:hypothetical protein